MTHRRRHIFTVLAFSCITGLCQAAPQPLSESQLDQVAAGLTPYRSVSDFNSTGAVAFATTNAVATPAGTAIVDAHVTTNVGLATNGFTSTIIAGVTR